MVEIPKRTDVFIVGGGPAGLAAAISLRARDFDVTVADPALPPIDKTCGEGLMPDTMAALDRLGVTLPAQHCVPFRGIRFLGDGIAVDASFPNGTGLAIRRTHLHQKLIDRANEAGATLLWGTTVKGLTETGVALQGGSVDCEWVVGADGQNSRVRQWAGLERAWRKSWRYGFRRRYLIAPWTECVEVYWGSGCQVYVTPTGREETSVVVISRDSRLRLDQALPLFPELLDRLKNVPATGPEHGAITATRRLMGVYRRRVVLIGDASGSVDAITGEGLQLGFKQALSLAQALSNDDLERYATAHRQIMRRPAFMADLLLSLDRSAWLRRRVLNAFSAEPRIFAAQLAMHVGTATTADFIRRSMVPLGRRILTA
jgi:flavin-dependent dehydrogenase